MFKRKSKEVQSDLAKPQKNEHFVEEKKSLFSRFKEGLSKTKEKLAQTLTEVFEVDRLITQADLNELEERLILSDLGVETTFALLEPIKRDLSLGKSITSKELKNRLREGLLNLLVDPTRPFPPQGNPATLFFLGVNGVGKTTTIAKLAKNFKDGGYKVLIVAGDTFRAGAIEQLQRWGERVGVPVYAQREGADPASVIYQGLDKAIKEGFELVLIDTAGRLHTKYNLMEELKKMARVIEKFIPQEGYENILVLDANTGQNAISQAESFFKAIPIHSVILTKMDGTAKGGVAFAISHKFKLPIRFIGLGEKPEDLLPFDKESFVKAILPE
ncbi:MAG: signal recognition particle-docking protein FtsY [Thermodesulfobacterium sp.]|nr:signal recognition particle-docking protein FtsY [Thermodesulfobacterium sp.]